MDTSWLEEFLTSPGNDGRAFSGVVDVRREGEVLFQSGSYGAPAGLAATTLVI